MAESLLEELKRYVEFSGADEAALRALHPVAAPHFVRIADVFYQRILDHEDARKALEGGESVVGKLKVTLVAWMDSLLTGPWDEAYYQRRARIGRVHVRIALPQHYMFGAMNVLRQELNHLVDGDPGPTPQQRRQVRAAVGKILDLELAIMLHTYREDLIEQQAKIERLSTFGQLVGSIGHELRNPLGVIETSVFILKGRIGPDERVQKHIDRIGQQLAIANGIVSALLDMIRDKPLAKEPVNLKAVIDHAVSAVHRLERQIVIAEGLESLPHVWGDPTQLRQVFLNLLENGAHAAGPGGTLAIRAVARVGSVEVSVEDSGPGVDKSVRHRLFEPLISTKSTGIGLGLALVKRIVQRHGGTIDYAPLRPESGARFVVQLPAEV